MVHKTASRGAGALARKRVVACLALLSTSAVAGSARAQVAEGRRFSVERFDPAPAGDPFFGVAAPQTDGNLRLHAVLIADYAHAPLVLRFADDRELIGTLIKQQLFLHASVSLAVRNRLLFNVDVPFVPLNQGQSLTLPGGETASFAQGAAFGDVRLGARVRVLGDTFSPFQLALAASVWVPTGKTAGFAGDDRVRVRPALIAGGRTARVLWSATTGFDFRRQGSYFDTKLSNELVLGGAIGVLLARERVLVGPEAYAITTVGNGAEFLSGETTTAELLLGGRVRLNPFVAGLAAGPGLTHGIGTPDVRVVAVLGYSPFDARPLPRSDRDGDGIPDDEDACPDVAGPRDPDPRKNGCPDSDGDGIIDREDACPHEAGPPSADPKKNGCPLRDRDGDGISDDEDACPDVPGVRDPDPKKNGCPPDRDGDGIPDHEDACPDVPGVRDPDPKKNGCPPESDRDGDGIIDKEDACPDVPGVPSTDPQSNGCPPKVKLTRSEIVILQKIQFKFDSATILPVSRDTLHQVAEMIKTHPEIRKVSIEGHTDEIGTDAYNMELSKRRARAVMRWLTDKEAVPSARLTYRGFGRSRPLAPNKTKQGREANRRVEFKIVERHDEDARPADATGTRPQKEERTTP